MYKQKEIKECDKFINRYILQARKFIECVADCFHLCVTYERVNLSSSSKAIVPFQIAYAVSIHKAQGLEYDSVKVIITEEIDELITHIIFYTAITRARKSLKIYWSQPVEEKVLSQIKPQDHKEDVALLRLEMP